MRPLLEQGDAEFLQELQQRGSATVQDLCDATHVTATAVRQRLTRLQGLSLVARVAGRAEGRGRPQHSYMLTDAGRRELGDNYAELALLLWEELQAIDEPAVRQRVVTRVRERLAQSYGADVAGHTMGQRFGQLQSALADRGFRVEVEQHGDLPVLRERHCPYHELAVSDPGICELEQQVYESVLGVPLRLTQCCRDGHASCEFHVATVELT